MFVNDLLQIRDKLIDRSLNICLAADSKCKRLDLYLWGILKQNSIEYNTKVHIRLEYSRLRKIFKKFRRKMQ